MKKGLILAGVVIIGLMMAGAVFAQEAQSTAQPQPQKVIRLHTVKSGENLHLLSAYYYGDARQWKKIWLLNKKEVRNPNIISVGQVLKVEVEPGWQPKFDLDKYLAETGAKIPEMKKMIPKEPTVVREREEVKPTVMPRLLEEPKKEEETKPPESEAK